MTDSTMISVTGMDWIVLTALLLSLAFVAAWILSPALRARIERPKYRFLADVRGYDRIQANGGDRSN